MQLKKYFIWTFFILFLSVCFTSGPTFAEEGYFSGSLEKETDCGVAGDVVAPKSFSICKEDISYNILYMVFSKVFNEFPILKAFVYENAGQLDSLGYAGEIGATILNLLLGFSQVVLIVGGLVLLYSTVKVMVGSMTSGEFLGKGVHKVWLILRSLLVIFLIFPIGTISIVQLLILMATFLGIMGANFFYGLFLNQVQTDAFEADSTTSEANSATAISQSEAMIQASLCQNRTTKALRNQLFKKYDDYFFTDLDFTDQIKRVANCIAPEVYFKFGDNDIKEGNVTNVNFGKKEMCNTSTGPIGSDYNVEYHGYPYSCGSISFSHPRLSNEINTSTGNSANNSIFSSLDSSISSFVQSSYNSYGMPGKLSGYYSKAQSVKSGGEFDFTSLDSEVTAYASTLESGATSLYNSVKAGSDHNTAVKSLYVAYAILYNNLLGAKSANAENPAKGASLALGAAGIGYEAVKEVRKQLNDKYAMKSGDAIAALEKYSSDAASSLDSLHCLQNFKKVYASTKKTLSELKEGTGDFEDYIKEHPSFYDECLWFTAESELNPKYANSNYAIGVGGSSVKVTMGANSGLVTSFDPQNPSSLGAVQESGVLNMALEAQANKIALAEHFYVVRAAIEKSFLDVLKSVSDKDIPQRMRKQGWAGFGGYIIQIASNQTNASRYVNRINSGVTWSGFNENNNIGMFINYDAFNSSINTKTLENPIPFTTMVMSNYFAGASTNNVVSGAVSGGKSAMSDDESSQVSSILAGIEDTLTAPMKYLKKMGGLDQSLPLREGVEKCFKEANCFSGEIHPLNALAYMGNDLVNVSIDYYIAKAVFNSLVYGISMLENGGSVSNDSSIIGKVKALGGKLIAKVGTIAIAAIKVINAALNALSPLFFLLLMLGLFFAYIVPMMPYISFLILFMGWLVLIFQLLIAIPIWLIMVAIPGPNGEARGNVALLWQYAGQVILRPSLMVIGMIFGWFLASVSIYFINLTFFGTMGPVVESTSGTIMGIVDVIMFYFAYLVVVFIALKYSFTIINSFPDAVSKAIDLRTIGDNSTINSLGSERLMQVAIMGKVLESAKKVGEELKQELSADSRKGYDKQEMMQYIRSNVASRTDAQTKDIPNPEGKETGDAFTDAFNGVADTLLGNKKKDIGSPREKNADDEK